MKVSEVAREAGVSVQAVYRAVKRLGNRLSGKVSKVNGVSEITQDGAALVLETLKASKGASIVKDTPAPLVQERQAPAADLSPVLARMESLEKSFLLVVEELKESRNELREVRKENAALRMLLAPPPVHQVARNDQVMNDPLAGLPWYRRLLVEIFEPHKMRRGYDS